MTLSSALLERLTEMPLGVQSADLLEQHPKLRDRAVILELADQVNRLAREDLSRAERLGDVVTWLSELSGDDFCRARAMRCLGNIQVMRSNYLEAIRYFDGSLGIFARLGIDQEEAATLSSSLQPLIYLGNYTEAFRKAQRAKHIATRLGDQLLLARLDINFGNILHRQDRFGEAVVSYSAALEVLKKLGESRDSAIAYLNMAVCHISLNDFSAAEKAYQQARVISEKENMPSITAQADYNIAYLHYHRGDYGRAIELYQHTRRYCLRVGDQLHSALCDMDQSEIYLDLHLYEDAMQLGRQARTAFQELNMPYEATKALVWLGIAAYQSRRSLHALELLAEARKRMESEGNKAWTAVLDLYQALLTLQEGRYSEAMRHCRNAQLVFTGHSSKAGHADLVRSDLHLAMGQPNDALAAVQRALAVGERQQSPGILSHGYQLLGKHQETQNLIPDATTSYRRSLDYLEKMPLQVNSEGLKIPYSKNRYELYESILSLGVASATVAPEGVLNIAEKSKSREVAELINFRANALQTPSRSRSALVEKLQSLREELSWYYRQTEDGDLKEHPRSDSQEDELRRLIRVREESLLNTLDAIRETEVEFHSVQTASIVPLDKVRQRLMVDELLIEFYEARGTLFVCLLTRDSCKVAPLTRMVLIREQLRRLNAQFARMQVAGHGPEGPPPQYGKIISILKTLHEILIEPIQNDIRERRLIIVPEGPLRYLPFHALYDGTQYLSQRHILSYAGSASLYYLASIKDPVQRGRDVLLQQPEVAAAQTASPSLGTFERVPNFQRLQRAGTLNRFIHLDCRLLARLDSPMLSTLIIGQSEKTIMDLFNLNLSCSVIGVTGTGSGIRADGDGKELEGLARALQYAGARSLILPLWNTFPEATNVWFDVFYLHASLNGDRAVAFQTTLAEVREKYPHPFYWAGFTLRGQTGRLSLQ